MRRRANVEWTREKVGLLGTDTDANVAARLGVHRGSVFQRRRILGIPAFGGGGGGPRAGFHWTARALALLGKGSDRAVAGRLGISETTVCLKRQAVGVPSCNPRPAFNWTAKRLALLGRRPDTELAREFGLNNNTVLSKRRALGIPRWRR